METMEKSVDKLRNYIESNRFRGHDPYDALKSPVFRLPIFNKAKLLRFGSQQFLKRFPVNLRPLLRIPKGYNPVTLGLCIQGYGYLWEVYPEKREEYTGRVLYLLEELEKLIPEGFSGACWGYDFDWQARRANIPAYQPTVVATGIIANGLFECWKITGIQKCADLVISASEFVLKDLNRTYKDDTFCFSYSPFDKQSVLNASMKGVRILSQAFVLTRDSSLIRNALPAVQFVLNYQQKDGSFVYSDKGKWIDNYHTGYVLDCLDEFIRNFNHPEFEKQLHKGLEFYESHFFTSQGIPRFFSSKTHPVDCTSAGQSILTLSRFGRLQSAERVARWMIGHMQSAKGFFYFRKFRTYTVKTSFMRWSNAWMFASLSYLLYKKHV